MHSSKNSQLRLVWRPATQIDIRDCLSFDPALLRGGVAARDRIISLWQLLTLQPSFQSAIVETDQPIQGHRIVAFGAAVFVSRAFAESELAQPRPGLTGRVLASLASSTPVILNGDQLRRENAGGGLNLVVLTGAVRSDLGARTILTERLLPFLSGAFLEIHRGYNLQRIIVELTDPLLRQRVERMRTWRIREFTDSQPDKAIANSAIAYMERGDDLVYEGSLSALLFQYQPPRLRFTPAEQEVLRSAITGLTDRELSTRLNLSRDTVKSRWLTVTRKVETAMPHLILEPEEIESRPGRGSQKRQHILHFLREHPEELRPFDWDAYSSTRKP